MLLYIKKSGENITAEEYVSISRQDENVSRFYWITDDKKFVKMNFENWFPKCCYNVNRFIENYLNTAIY